MTKSTLADDGREGWKKFVKMLAALGLLKVVMQFIHNGRLTISQVTQGLSALGTLGWLS